MGTAVTRPEDPTRSGYAFMGWFIDSSYTTAYDFETPISGTTTTYAKWRQMYTVDFNTYGGSVVTPQVIPVNPPFTFGGWYTGIEMTETWDFNIPVTENRTFHARWLAGETDPDFAPGTPIAQAFTVATSAEWESARSAIASIGGGKNFIINVTGDVFSQPNSNCFSSGGGTLVIRGTGENRTISLALNGSFFSVGSNQKVFLRDITLK